jgi:hypothetical protein
MEDKRFERLVMTIGQETNRRTLLRALLLGALTGLRDQVAAAKPKDKDKKPKCGEICVPGVDECPEKCSQCIPAAEGEDADFRCILPVCLGVCTRHFNQCPKECEVCVDTGEIDRCQAPRFACGETCFDFFDCPLACPCREVGTSGSFACGGT